MLTTVLGSGGDMQYSVDNLQLNTCINNFLTLKLNFKYHSSLVEKIRRDKLSGLSIQFFSESYIFAA